MTEPIYPPILAIVERIVNGKGFSDIVDEIIEDKAEDMIRNELWFKVVPEPWLSVLRTIDTCQDFWIWLSSDEMKRLNSLFTSVSWLGILWLILNEYGWLHG